MTVTMGYQKADRFYYIRSSAHTEAVSVNGYILLFTDVEGAGEYAFDHCDAHRMVSDLTLGEIMNQFSVNGAYINPRHPDCKDCEQIEFPRNQNTGGCPDCNVEHHPSDCPHRD